MGQRRLSEFVDDLKLVTAGRADNLGKFSFGERKAKVAGWIEALSNLEGWHYLACRQTIICILMCSSLHLGPFVSFRG
jgi:hypothetical protein